jgi:hypothetical protein
MLKPYNPLKQFEHQVEVRSWAVEKFKGKAARRLRLRDSDLKVL